MTGYYGKVSTHGDFVSRRLPADLVQAWDAWLQECLQTSQATLGPVWLERYLNSPVWRFAIAPGVLGPEGIGGVMMPSVDRVGRYFPLMLGAIATPALLEWFHDQASWYDEIENLARESLAHGFVLAHFDSAPEPEFATSVAKTAAARSVSLSLSKPTMIDSSALQGYTLWWTEGGPFVEASTLVCKGMPRLQDFTAMLDGVRESSAPARFS